MGSRRRPRNAKEAIKDLMKQIAQDAVVTEIALFSEKYLVDRLEAILPNVIQSFGYAKSTDIAGVNLQC